MSVLLDELCQHPIDDRDSPLLQRRPLIIGLTQRSLPRDQFFGGLGRTNPTGFGIPELLQDILGHKVCSSREFGVLDRDSDQGLDLVNHGAPRGAHRGHPVVLLDQGAEGFEVQCLEQSQDVLD
jgi:hypothetical protein